MKKQTKALLIVAVIGVGGYLFWKSRMGSKKNLASMPTGTSPCRCGH